MINALLDLLETKEGEFEPKPYALKTAISLVTQAVMESGVNETFSPFVTLHGAVRVNWRHRDKEVTLEVSGDSEENLSVYIELRGKSIMPSVLDQDITYPKLAAQLKWLVS